MNFTSSYNHIINTGTHSRETREIRDVGFAHNQTTCGDVNKQLITDVLDFSELCFTMRSDALVFKLLCVLFRLKWNRMTTRKITFKKIYCT